MVAQGQSGDWLQMYPDQDKNAWSQLELSLRRYEITWDEGLY